MGQPVMPVSAWKTILYMGPGVKAVSNAERVERAVANIRKLIRKAATPDETPRIPGLNW